MSYYLNEENEAKLSEFLVKENEKICKEQLKSDTVPDQFRDLIKKTMDSGSPLPFFDPKFGYYSVSFTPCENGTRIYAHHHISNVSECIHDPAKVTVIVDDSGNEEEDNKLLETPSEALKTSIEDMSIREEAAERESMGSVPVDDDGITGSIEIDE